MLILSEYNELNLYLEDIRHKTNNTIMNGIVSDVYIEHNEIVEYILDNLDLYYPDNYIGSFIGQITGELKIDYKELINDIVSSNNVNINQYLNLYINYIEFIIKKINGLSDIKIIDLFSNFYANVYEDIQKEDITQNLKSKYSSICSNIDYEDQPIIKKRLRLIRDNLIIFMMSSPK